MTAVAAAGSRPRQTRRGLLRTAELRFGHPFAVVAVTADHNHRPRRDAPLRSPWQDLPVFSAWITQPEDARNWHSTYMRQIRTSPDTMAWIDMQHARRVRPAAMSARTCPDRRGSSAVTASPRDHRGHSAVLVAYTVSQSQGFWPFGCRSQQAGPTCGVAARWSPKAPRGTPPGPEGRLAVDVLLEQPCDDRLCMQRPTGAHRRRLLQVSGHGS